MKIVVCLLLIILALFVALPAAAQQEAEPIEYGSTRSGEITDSAFEIPYTFSGAQGDMVIVRMTPVDVSGDLDNPALKLLNSDSIEIASVDGVGSALLAIKLPNDGDFTILATRRDGAAGESVGAFTLELIHPPMLEAAAAVEGGMSSEQVAFYVLETASPFEVVYQKTSGDFAPQVSVNLIVNNGLDAIGVLYGKFLTHGTIGTTAAGGPDNPIYIIMLSRPLFEFYFEEASVNYTLTIVPQ